MKTKVTAIATALSIAISGAYVTPANATTREQGALLFFFGAVAGALLANGSRSTAATPAPAPRYRPPAPRHHRALTFSTGPLDVRQGSSFDLYRGRITRGRAADLLFTASDIRHRYLVPLHGAKISLGDLSNRGYAGCARSRFTSHRIPLRAIPVGSYVCVKTGAGRISRFRVNGISRGRNKTLRLGYTTWQ